jgi:hypothetical protein
MHRIRDIIDIDGLPSLFPHRVARVTELLALGMSTEAIGANTAADGPWQRLLPGILLLTDAPPSRTQVVQAALRYAGSKAVLTGHDALQLHGIRSAKPGGPVHVLVPQRRQVRAARTVLVERTARLPSPVLRNDFPVAPLERAVLDAARRMRSVDGIRAIIAESIQRGGVQPRRLRAELTKGSGRGSASARSVLDEITTGVRSMAEGLARRLVVGSQLPKPRWRVTLCGSDGDVLDVVDAWWDDLAVAWNVIPDEPQLPAATFERMSKLSAAGITVLHTTANQLRTNPSTVLRDLEQTLLQARTRSRPHVIAS